MGDQAGDRERFSRLVIQRVLTAFDASDSPIEEKDAEYLLKRLGLYAAA